VSLHPSVWVERQLRRLPVSPSHVGSLPPAARHTHPCLPQVDDFLLRLFRAGFGHDHLTRARHSSFIAKELMFLAGYPIHPSKCLFDPSREARSLSFIVQTSAEQWRSSVTPARLTSIVAKAAEVVAWPPDVPMPVRRSLRSLLGKSGLPSLSCTAPALKCLLHSSFSLLAQSSGDRLGSTYPRPFARTSPSSLCTGAPCPAGTGRAPVARAVH
jgi:hypothetical protein